MCTATKPKSILLLISNHTVLFKSTIIVTLAAALTPFISANPVDANTSPALPDDRYAAWGQFCDDTNCQVNCGQWVDLSNSGCLANEGGRNSLNIKSNGPDPMFGLVYSPGTQCNCQLECEGFAGGIEIGCQVLNITATALSNSYRMINFGIWSGCDSPNNC